MIDLTRLKEDLFYFPTREELKKSEEYVLREDFKIKQFASDSLAEIYSPLVDTSFPIITYSEGKFIKSWLDYIYTESKYFVPVFAHTNNLILVSYKEIENKYNFHYKVVKENDISLKVYNQKLLLLEEHFDNKNLSSIFINSIIYNNNNNILIEKYNIGDKFYHPIEVHKYIDNKNIKEMIFKNKKIKEWIQKMNINPFNIDDKMIDLFNLNFHSLTD